MWTPTEVRKLIAQIAGFVFCGIGVWLLISDVKASGSLDISSNVLSGKIESGSAGLFLIFLGFFLLLVPALFGSKHHQVNSGLVVSHSHDTLENKSGDASDTIRLKKLFISSLGLVGISVGLLFFGSHLNSLDMGIGILFIVAGVVSGLVGAVMLLVAIIKWTFPDIEFS